MTMLAFSERLKRKNVIPFLIAIFSTICDGLLTLYEYNNHMIIEANGVWASLFQSIPSAAVMLIRIVFGILVLFFLLLVSERKNKTEQKMSTFGLWFCAIILLLIVCYHIFGLLFLV